MIKVTEHTIKDLDEQKGIVTIYVNSFDNEDSDGDISVKGSFKKTIRENLSRIKHFLNHDRDKLVGVPVEMFEDDWGLIAVSQLNLKKELGRDVFEDYKLYAEHNKTLEHSVRVNDIKRDQADGRKVLEWKLWEYSTLYGWGANEMTPLINVKELADLELMMREGNYSDEKREKIEQLYNKLKALLTKPGALSDEPQSLDEKELFKHFINKLKI